MSHDHETIVIDSDKHFVIDPVTRAITTESPKLKLMQYDHKSERFTFEIPKTIEGHDMTLCNKIRIHYLNTGSGDRHPDVHEVSDMQVSKDDPEKLLFSWLIERTATQFAGTLSFAVRFYCILDDSTVDYSWGTDIFNSITVSNGMENTDQVIEDYSDLIASIQKEIEDLKLNGVGGTKDYSALTNKPSIGGVELVGDKTLDDIGAQPKGTYLTKESDPTVPSWAKNPTKPTYTATEVGADPTGTAQNKVSAHNTAGDAHNDIRLLVQGLTDRLNALADSDDDTLDQMSEIVAYIKSNKSLIDGITTGKVNVADIVNNLTTNASNKPLSAAQGVALKALIDGISVPTKLPNPNKLIFTGAVTDEYDGSVEKSILIPEGGGTSGVDYVNIADVTVDESEVSLVLVPLDMSKYSYINGTINIPNIEVRCQLGISVSDQEKFDWNRLIVSINSEIGKTYYGKILGYNEGGPSSVLAGIAEWSTVTATKLQTVANGCRYLGLIANADDAYLPIGTNIKIFGLTT